MRSGWSVGKQIGATFAGVMVMLALFIGLAIKSIWDFVDAAATTTQTHEILNGLERLTSEVKDAETGHRGYVITGDEAYLEPYHHALSSIDGEFQRLRTLLAHDPEQLRRLEALRPATDRRLASLRANVEVRRSKGFDAALAVINTGEGKQLMDTFRAGVQELRRDCEDELKKQREELAGETRALNWVFGAGAAVALAFVLLSGLGISRSLNRQIDAAVTQVQGSSAELQSAASQQASGAREQASATTEISTTVKELLTTSRQISTNAQQVARVADETAGAASSGNETVQHAQEAIDSVRRQVDAIVNHMLELGKRSQEIGGILDIINELADQTNILAINATIESAGAGEHGRRFAVVAEEIRKLADRVGTSTKDIRVLIDEIRAASNTTIMATEDGSKAVQSSARQFAEVAGSFKRIAELVRANLDVAREIELSTQQQTTAVEQVNTAILEVAHTARQSETSSSQTLQTATQLIQVSQQLSALIDTRTAA